MEQDLPPNPLLHLQSPTEKSQMPLFEQYAYSTARQVRYKCRVSADYCTALQQGSRGLFTSDVSVDDVDELAAPGDGDAVMPGVDELANDPGHVAVEVPEVWVPVVEEEVVLVG